MTKQTKPRKYRVKYWPVRHVPVQQVMPWAVVTPAIGAVYVRCYFKSQAQKICRLLNRGER